VDAGQTVVVGAGGQGGTAAPAAALSAAAIALPAGSDGGRCGSPYRAGDGRVYRCDLARGHGGSHQWGGPEVWLSWDNRCVCQRCGAQLHAGRCPACMEAVGDGH
jgi:hypothetical protein